MNSRLKLRILDQQAFSKLIDPIFFQVVKLTILCEMAFILGVGNKTADQPQGRKAANFGFFIQP